MQQALIKSVLQDLAQNAESKAMRGRLQGRLIIYYQICDHALHVLADLFIGLLKGSGESIAKNHEG